MNRQHVLRAVLVVVAVLVASCSSSGSGSTAPSSTLPTTTTAPPIALGEAPLRLELIRPAVAALEAQLGGPQRYFEINATLTLVNLFVATDNGTKAVAYVYKKTGLEAPAAAQQASGPTFAGAEMTFDETRVMALVVSQLPKSTFRLFSVTGAPNGGVTYGVTVDSELGSEFVVTVGPSGAVLGTDQLTGQGS